MKYNVKLIQLVENSVEHTNKSVLTKTNLPTSSVLEYATITAKNTRISSCKLMIDWYSNLK